MHGWGGLVTSVVVVVLEFLMENSLGNLVD